MRGKLRVAVALFLCLSLCACSPRPIQRASFALDTLCAVTVYTARDEGVLDDALAVVDRWEHLLSRYETDSLVYALNQNGGGKADAVVQELIALSQQVSELSGGAFDIALGNVSDLWGFGTQSPQVPAQEQIEQALLASGFDKVHVQGDEIVLDDGAALDFGAVAKGYIAQRVKEYLLEQSVNSAIVNLGGNVALVGQRPGGGAYTVGIQAPLSADGTLVATVRAQDCAVVTSGVYERCFEQDGTLYHHVLDPKTGAPAVTDLLSVTVLCEDASLADAMSTALLILGRERATALVETLPGVEAIFVDETFSVTYSEGLTGKVEVLL